MITIKDNLISLLRKFFANKTLSKIEQCLALLEDFRKGMRLSLIITDIGTRLIVKGKTKTTIMGDDFMEAIFSIYLGEAPASKQLKSGLLGHK